EPVLSLVGHYAVGQQEAKLLDLPLHRSVGQGVGDQLSEQSSHVPPVLVELNWRPVPFTYFSITSIGEVIIFPEHPSLEDGAGRVNRGLFEPDKERRPLASVDQ